MFKGKPTKVIITGNAKDEFDDLNKIVAYEIKKGVSNSVHQILLNSILQKVSILKDNPEYGVHIPKDRIPKEYIKNYGVTNLWKVNLSGAWRMIYTVRGSELEIISLILDMMNHRDYEKKFKYKKS